VACGGYPASVSGQMAFSKLVLGIRFDDGKKMGGDPIECLAHLCGTGEEVKDC